jgi:AraC-like DNA-binding protein
MSTVIKREKLVGSHLYDMKEKDRKLVVDLIKSLVAEYYSGEFLFEEHGGLKSFIESQLDISFAKANAWFIRTEEKTIVHYATGLRLNKLKELLVYTDLSLEAIAAKLNYSSQETMEDELVKQTGLRTDHFRKMRKQKERLALRQRLRSFN